MNIYIHSSRIAFDRAVKAITQEQKKFYLDFNHAPNLYMPQSGLFGERLRSKD